jgi:membrane fusion protein (multidrug efflux system)
VSTIESEISGNGHDQRTASPKAMITPFIILAIVVVVILGGIFAWQTFIGKMMKQYMAAAATAPQTVSTAVAASTDWQAYTQAIGSLRAVRGADLASQASGVVDEIHIESGTEVPAGTVLLKLRPYDDPAKLAQLEAAAVLAEQTYKRDQEGIRQVDEGQYLTAGTTVVTLQALDPILIDFYVPQQALAHIKVGQATTATVDTYPGAHFAGTIASINSKVDLSSRNVQVRASFPNPDRRLLPGMYANVEVANGSSTAEITLPQAAITYNPYGDTVFIVQKAGVDEHGKPKSTVQQRFVQLGETRGDQVAVKSGLAAGDVVVTAGQMKLRNGSNVVIDNTVTPANDINPTPPNE